MFLLALPISFAAEAQHTVAGNKVTFDVVGTGPILINIRADGTVGSAGGYAWIKVDGPQYTIDLPFAANKPLTYGVKEASAANEVAWVSPPSAVTVSPTAASTGKTAGFDAARAASGGAAGGSAGSSGGAGGGSGAGGSSGGTGSGTGSGSSGSTLTEVTIPPNTIVLGGDLFDVAESPFDFINSWVQIQLRFKGTDPNRIAAKSFPARLQIPEINYDKSITVTTSQTVDLNAASHIGMSFSFSQQEIDLLKTKFPNAIVPYTFTLNEGTQKIFEVNGYVKFLFVTDNFEYKIGVVQVIPPGLNFDTANGCLLQFVAGAGYEPLGGYAEDCSTRGGPTQPVRSFKIKDYIFSDSPTGYTTLDGITTIMARSGGTASQKIYSFKFAGKYWESLLLRHGISNTRLKKNPRFSMVFLPPVQEARLDSNERGPVKAYFSNVVKKNQINLAPYDFIIYMEYKSTTDITFSRAFVAGTRAYIPVNFAETGEIVLNKAFLTLVHEMGHQLFGLQDFYDGYKLLYPQGVPDPNKVTQTKACIMAKGFGKEILSGTCFDPGAQQTTQCATSYSIGAAGSDITTPESIVFFHDPLNYILCAKDIVDIQGENSNCPLVDFYTKRCGTTCTSENYLTSACTKQP
mgnify:CR=1 FL=1